MKIISIVLKVLVLMFVGTSTFVYAGEIDTSCLQTDTLGCSVPTSVKVSSPHATYYTDKFAPACVKHDYCYRHGKETYNQSKKTCDDNFYSKMKSICKTTSWIDVVTLGGSVVECLTTAQVFHQAVAIAGSSAYKGTDGTCCAYNGTDRSKITKQCGGTMGASPTGSLHTGTYSSPRTSGNAQGSGGSVIPSKVGEGVECTLDSECGRINKCVNNKCKPGCSPRRKCAEGFGCTPRGFCAPM